MADATPVVVVGLLGGRPVGDIAAAALAAADLVAGGRDQLAAVADLLAPGARTVVVGAGLGALDEVASHPGPAAACVLASGDPGFFGIVRALAARVGAERLVVHPAPSSVALAFARLGLPWDGAVVRSCHTGDAARVAAEVARSGVAAVLTGPDAPPEAVGAALVALGAHHRLVVVATRLGEPGEQVVRCSDLADLAAGGFDHRSVVVLAHPPAARSSARLGGRPVADFAHRASMITKPEVRSVVLGKLDLPERGVLWDVGAGSGSVAVEAALAAPGLRVIAVERNHEDADRVMANADALGALVEVVEGAAPAALDGLPAPDRVFVGGGGLDVLDACLTALRPGGRLVATFAAVDRAVEAHRRLGNLVQVGVDRAEVLPDGGIRFAADNPVFVAWGDAPEAPGDVAAVGAPRVVVGIGCSSDATSADVAAVMAEALAAVVPGPVAASPGPPDIGAFDVATIDLRADHPAVREAAPAGGRLMSFPSSLLGLVDVPNPSDVVAGSGGHAKRGGGGRHPGRRARRSAARRQAEGRHGHRGGGGVHLEPAPDRIRSQIVGLGPGGGAHRTPAATAAVRGADAVVGYGPYVDAAGPLLRPDQLVLRGTMGAEADRALAALALARAGLAGGAGVVRRPRRLRHGRPHARVGRRRPARRRHRDRARGDRGPRRGRRCGRSPRGRPRPRHPLRPARSLVHHRGPPAGRGLVGDGARPLQPPLRRTPRPPGPGPGRPRRDPRPIHPGRGRHRRHRSTDQSVVRTTLAELDPTIVGMRSMVLIGGR